MNRIVTPQTISGQQQLDLKINDVVIARVASAPMKPDVLVDMTLVIVASGIVESGPDAGKQFYTGRNKVDSKKVRSFMSKDVLHLVDDQKNPKNPAQLYQKFSEIVQAAPHIHSCDASARQQERKENRAYNAFRKACEALGLNHIEEAKKYGNY
jgi:hypothetical protein